MSSIELPPSLAIVQKVLGEGYVDNPNLLFGASHSGHGVRFGEYEGSVIAAKPYWGRKAHDNALREQHMTNLFAARGFATLRDLGVYTLDGITPRENLAVFATEYVGEDYTSVNTLTIEADPSTEEGKKVGAVIIKVSTVLGEVFEEKITPGDSQIKNYLVHKANMDEEIMVIDVEKGTPHDSKRNRGVIASAATFAGAIKRDLKRLSFSLGTRQYGAGVPDYFSNTVIEPMMEVIGTAVKSEIDFIPIITATVENFHTTMEAERLREVEIG